MYISLDSKGSRSTNVKRKGGCSNENKLDTAGRKRPLDVDEEVVGQLRDKSNVVEILSKVKVSCNMKE